MKTIVSKILRWRLQKFTFPQLSKTKYNRLWEVSHRTFKNLGWVETIKTMKNIILDNYSLSSLLTIPAIALIIKISNILEEKDTDSHLKMFKALNVGNNNVNYFLKCSIIFSLILRVIELIVKLFWFPLKLAILFYILDYFNYDVSLFYYKLNNLSLGVLDWYYKTFIDFLESLTIKNYIITR